MMKKITVFFLLLLTIGSIKAQNPIYTKFVFQNGNQSFLLDEAIPAANGINYSVHSMAFYVSRVEIIHDGNQVLVLDSNDVFYVNYNAPEIYLGDFNITNVEGIRFQVGVPEHLNHLDISQYPEGDPLSFQDPSMHWGWSSGYMHMIMNGKGDTDNDGVTEAAYELNCLGDLNTPFTEVMTTATVYPDNKRQIVLLCHVDEWLRGTNPATTGILHGSTGLNITVMHNVESHPVFTSPATASIIGQDAIELSVAQLDASVLVSWEDADVATYRLIDAEGKLIQQGNCLDHQLSFTDLTAGMHLLQLFTDKNSVIGTARWITP